jgi:hypothetical protein
LTRHHDTELIAEARNRWKDAERDCSTAISLAKGEANVKALYRRSLARKALGEIDGAIEGESSYLPEIMDVLIWL